MIQIFMWTSHIKEHPPTSAERHSPTRALFDPSSRMSVCVSENYPAHRIDPPNCRLAGPPPFKLQSPFATVRIFIVEGQFSWN